MNFKEYIAQQLLEKKLHFKCNCLFPIDHDGVIKDYFIDGNEIVFKVLIGDKLISIGENHPNLIINEV